VHWGSEQQEELSYQVTYHTYVHCSWWGTAVIHTKCWMLWSGSRIY